MSKNEKNDLEGLAALAAVLDPTKDPNFILVLTEMKGDPEWVAIEQIGKLEGELAEIADTVAERKAMQAKLPDLQKIVNGGLESAKAAVKKSIETTSKRAGTMKTFQDWITRKAEEYCLTQPEWVKAKSELEAAMTELTNSVDAVTRAQEIEFKISNIMKNLAKEAK